MLLLLFFVVIDWIMRKIVGNKWREIRWIIIFMLEEVEDFMNLGNVSSKSNVILKEIGSRL